MAATHPVVGSWRVAVDVPSAGVHGQNLATLSPDGAVVVAFPSPTPAAPGQGHALEYWSTALGSWEATSATGAAMTFVSLGADETGKPIGAHTITATVEADATGWGGAFRIEVSGPDGTVLGGVDGTVTATPIRATATA